LTGHSGQSEKKESMKYLLMKFREKFGWIDVLLFLPALVAFSLAL